MPDLDLEPFRDDFRAWLARNGPRLDLFRVPPRTAEEQVAQAKTMQRLLFDDGWAQHGWPEHVGGRGGSALRRGVVAEELTRHGTPPPFACTLIEVLGPAVIEFGGAELAGTYFPRLLDGTDLWCQGFSEPEAGSDLGSLRTRAIDEGDHWRVNGQKIRDMDSPGIEVRPIKAMSGDEEFAELFLDEAASAASPRRQAKYADGGSVRCPKTRGMTWVASPAW